MERGKSLNNSSNSIPIGFRFRPTDEELLVHYLKRKVFSQPLPAASVLSLVPPLDVFSSNPWDLPGDLNDKRYFFTKRKTRNNNVLMMSTATGCGYWKSCPKHTPISAAGSNNLPVIIGIKKTLVFYKFEIKFGVKHVAKTQWIMHLFSLTSPLSTQQKLMVEEVGDWVLCRIYQRRNRTKPTTTTTRLGLANCTNIHQLGLPFPDQPCYSSSCSSGITHEFISSANDHHHLDQEATSTRI